MILIHILPPHPHSEKHTSLSLGARRQRPRAQWPAVRACGGGGGGRSRADRRAGKRGGWEKRRILTSPSMLSLSQIAHQELNRSAAQHKKTTARKESSPGIAHPLESPAQSLYLQNQKGRANHIRSPPLPNQRNT
jgi:hypothetical protein